MTDLKITKLCAEALGYRTQIAVDMATKNGDEYLLVWSDGEVRDSWNPLTDDAQAMALVKRFDLCVWGTEQHTWRVMGHRRDDKGVLHEFDARGLDLNRAICECVAKMQEAKNV